MIRQPILKAAIISMIVVWIIATSYVGFLTVTEIKFWDGKEPWSDVINSKWHLDQEKEILYLDAGDAPYFFRANSSCRYSTPLPFQRDDPKNWSLEWMPQFQEEYSCINAYQGKYIVMDGSFDYDWIGTQKSNRKALNELLANNYTRIWTRCWFIYEKKDNL